MALPRSASEPPIDGEPAATAGPASRPIAEALALEPNVWAVAAAMFGMGLGQHLWYRFLPKYLERLGAPVLAIGLFGTAEDSLDGIYQYPGGWVADRYGCRVALLLFISVAAAGFAIYAVAPSWPFVFLGLVFAMAWGSMASPTIFAVIGDALPRHKRTMGFTVQSILRRIPIAVAPALGGLLIARYGVRGGVRLALLAAIAIALVTLGVAARVRVPVLEDEAPIGIRGVWRSFPAPLRRLLASDILVRTCEGLVDVFLVLYAIDVVGIDAPRFGALVAVEMTTSILAYVPAARLADRTGRKPFVIATFVAFALFPAAVASARSFAGLAAAFAIGGLRELGEPARKALILDLTAPALRARAVGLYYLVRSLAVAPAALVGGLLWKVAPALPFYVAALVGLAGAVVFAWTVEERYAG